ncbi:MAG: PAS domain S-box protein [Syntrophobacteraceae bacterium]|nr:PAS domain S-box protein [Syntrophobacteraceae bacterium]
MAEHKSEEDRTAGLRRIAEERSGERATQIARTVAEQDDQGLAHELQVHQIELEMQNAELRTAQEQLSESLARYSDLYDFAPVGYVTVDSAGLILESNLTFAAQLGLERGRLIGSPLWLYAAAPDRGKVQSHLDQVLKTSERRRRTCELRLAGLSGPEHFVQLDSIRARNVDGVKVCRISVTDISHRKEAEAGIRRMQEDLESRVKERTLDLSESEGKFRRLFSEFQTLLNAISDTLVLVSPDMEVLWMNHGDAQPLDEALSEVMTPLVHDLLHGPTASSGESPVARCFKTGGREVSVVTRNGVVLDLRAFPIKEDGKVSSVLLLVSDITEKMALQAEAMQACHLATLGELAAGIAHEINNPITGIINYGQILVNECSAGSLENDIGRRIVKEGERIGHIVKTLLSYARDDEREAKRATTIAALIEESVILTQAQMRKDGIDFRMDLPEDLPEVHVNFQQIQQSIINIISNARYALNEKYPKRHKNKILRITGDEVIINDRPYVRVLFHDLGIGIPPHELPLLKKAFFSTKPMGKGTGLGLSITDRIITNHEGFLGFESLEGEFTRVTIDLPVKVSNECQDSCN